MFSLPNANANPYHIDLPLLLRSPHNSLLASLPSITFPFSSL